MNNFKNIIALNIAAYEKNCILRLLKGGTSTAHSFKYDSRLGHAEVPAMVLDQILKELEIKKVDWIKIDVEGSECEVLKGLKNTLRKFRPKLIIKVFKENMHNVKELLDGLNYASLPVKECKDFNPTYLYCYPY